MNPKTLPMGRRRGFGVALAAVVTVAATVVATLIAASPAAQATSLPPLPTAVPDDAIVLFRHATAPGFGDPPGFRLGDCSSQRNLDEAGREQARRIGEQLRRQRVPVAQVWTSQWCRTRETAALAFPTLRAVDQPDFNSFFDERSAEPAQTARARRLLLAWRGPGVLVVTTHQVNITALTGVTPASGEGVVLRSDGHELRVVGRMAPPAPPAEAPQLKR